MVNHASRSNFFKAELNSKPTACLCERTLNDKRNTHGKLQLGFACGYGSLAGPNRQTMGLAWACQIPVSYKAATPTLRLQTWTPCSRSYIALPFSFFGTWSQIL